MTNGLQAWTIAMDNEEYEETKKAKLCAACVGEAFLKNDVETLGADGTCDYCHQPGKTFTIGELCERVALAFEQNYSRCSEDEGEAAADAIMNAGGFPEDAAKDMQKVLEYEHEPSPGDYVGDDGEFAEEVFYAEKSADGEYWHDLWREFEKTLKTEARYFSRIGEDRLKSVFEGIETMQTQAHKPLIIDAGPNTELAAFYRARSFELERDLELALQRPDLHLGPPPMHLAKDGRMNARGISVFYGAGDAKTALAEVRPPVGAKVVTARFEVLRALRLLDLTALGEVHVTGSVFDKAYAPRLDRVIFLSALSRMLTRPVLPTDEAFSYLATQAIADFLASRPEPVVDGILFPSVQTNDGALNVVLFHKAARVLALDLPKGTKLRTISLDQSDGLSMPMFTVWEEVPPASTTKEPVFPEMPNFIWHDPNADMREATLRVDLASLQVHFVDGIKFKTTDASVGRQRREERAVPIGKPIDRDDFEKL